MPNQESSAPHIVPHAAKINGCAGDANQADVDENVPPFHDRASENDAVKPADPHADDCDVRHHDCVHGYATSSHEHDDVHDDHGAKLLLKRRALRLRRIAQL